ncbi:MAG: malonyl-CoA decarboxylase [Anderseniella sp.]|jgi:malonyl-CoA decarboxylase|nr:malonyl-CoA decarboxylase [Anderseniella sp.]
MSRISYLQDLLSSLFERREQPAPKPDARDMLALCKSLLSDSGEVSRLQTAGALLEKYGRADNEHKLAFFKSLAGEFDVDTDELATRTAEYAQQRDAASLNRLLAVAEPRRQELLRRLNSVPGGTEKLVRMREDLLAIVREDESLARIDVDFEHLFSSWFNRGFLVLRPIDWTTPAYLLEKIIKYEAVHAIDSWDDLRRRLQPPDRRCFAFFHPAMPDEPLIFVEVALTRGIPGSIQMVLAEDRAPQGPETADTAVFYSISNCQKGLRGVSFGNFLIKQVAQDLAQGLPNIKTFVTLSPVPGFMRWFKQAAAEDDGELLERLHLEASVMTPDNIVEASGETIAGLTALAARYFLQEQSPKGGPIDPVARFHLGNGASLKAIHWLGDRSENGIRQSAGMMVNYLYDLKSVDANHEAFSRDGKVIASREVQSLLDPKYAATAARRQSND